MKNVIRLMMVLALLIASCGIAAAQTTVFTPNLTSDKPLDLTNGKDKILKDFPVNRVGKLFPNWSADDIWDYDGVVSYDLNLGYDRPLQQLHQDLTDRPIDKNEVGRVILIDLNKDGYTDALVSLGRYGSEKTLYFDAYVWDVEEFGGTFIYVENFRNIPNPRMEKGSSNIIGMKGADREVWSWSGKSEIVKKKLNEGVHSGGGNNSDFQTRMGYRFVPYLADPDGDDFNGIIVKAFKGNDNSSVFEWKHDFVRPVSAETAQDTKWVNDKDDINFDGVPDLQIYLWCYATGQVISSYAGYVWNSQGYFEEVKLWQDLCNPEIHPDSKTITANYRSGANERTYETYKWVNGKLELVSTSKKPLIEE